MLTVAHLLRGKENTVWSIQPEETVYAALALMAEKQIGALPVVAKRALVGIVSERDYARKVVLKGKDSHAIMVQEIMTAQVITVARDQSIEECMKLMTEHNIRHLPVLEQGELVGILSMRDVVKAIISDQKGTIDQMQRYIMGESL